jgi:hypothetical protein
MNPNLELRFERGIEVAENLIGLDWMRKVFAGADQAFLSRSKLDLDTDGVNSPVIQTWDVDHQGQTSLDPHGEWLCSNDICYIVLPEGFSTPYRGQCRHGGCPLGTLATVVYGPTGAMCHAVFADVGPYHQFGEASIAVHRALGFERVEEGKILDEGIEDGVTILIYIGHQIGKVPFVQADITAAASPLWAEFTARSG